MLHASPQFLADDHTEMLKRRKCAMEQLEFLVDNRIAKGVDEGRRQDISRDITRESGVLLLRTGATAR